ncbi:ribonuclease Z [Firmicutes bacterium OM04-13BH]|uniref:Ribonuclease Z n=2 Tax=Blautia stercoris TaxID=871664 RepID=A0ABR7PAJ2_9FIRM|nr:ribonuclease Z [Blautia stercoris]RGF22344.1 ribonuclease Z [Firmicutes bacterium AM10-47]RHV46581.1 ribonuclease Z [Firmicutes bacterium OM04-13BH]
MEVILTLENRNGMLFNHRRLSRDRRVCEKILDYSNEKELWMNAYSRKLFTDLTDINSIQVDEEFLDKSQSICFVENQDITPYLPKIDTLVLFQWNRDYPADFFFTVDLSQWNLISTEDFEGTSHEKITMEVYKKDL